MPRKLRRLLTVSALAVGLMTANGEGQAADLENTLYLDLKDGRVIIELRPDLAPNHVARIKELVREGFYDGLKFHLIQPGKLIQGGDINSRDDDPSNDGLGDPGFFLPAEIKAPHMVGSVGLAHPPDEPNRGNSQFYICLDNMPQLNDRYTVFGQVVEGIRTLRKISQVPLDENGHPRRPVIMEKVRVEKRVAAPVLTPDAK